MPRHPSHILELAKRGAEVRFREVVDELKRLAEAFPHLRDSFDKDELPFRFILRRGSDRSKAKVVRRRKMSAAARKALSERMKKYWAARRTQKGS